MQGYYDTEFQPELKRADVERELARAALADDAGAARRSRFREWLVAVLVALAAQLAPADGDGMVAEHPTTGTGRA